jgi:hypothetical protein
MKTLKDIYTNLIETPSDINEHLETLKMYADECDHITEMGVRGAVSTVALLMGKPYTMISYDIVDCDVENLKIITKHLIDFNFVKANTLKIQIEHTDLLFIDTLHNYTQLSQELSMHAKNVDKYIILHDTTSYEYVGESYDGKPHNGIWPAVLDFLDINPEWEMHERYTNNNGLTILKKNTILIK